MKPRIRLHFGAVIGAVCLACAGAAAAADNEAGVPLSPGDAAGPWTIESQGHSVCVIRLSAARSGPGFGLRAGQNCGDALPAGAAGWKPSADGMAIISADGQTLIDFGRWSNSLFVSQISNGGNVQLKRGAPGPNY
jgi:hypothetical protein